MAMIEEIRTKVAAGQFEFSQQAVDQSIVRRISVAEIREAFSCAEVIEDYPDDKYGPSCLLLGFAKSGRALHLQVTYPSRPTLKLITVYEPDPAGWIDFRSRKN